MRILIVDDVELNRLVLDAMLRGCGQTVLVENGAEGVWAAEEAMAIGDPFDLICMDIQMPKMDGLQALHAIRAAERRNQARRSLIVMVTASRSPDDMLRSLEDEGCDAFVVKPVLWQTLHGVLCQHGLLEEAPV